MFDWDVVDTVVASVAKVVAAAAVATPVNEFPMALVFCFCFWPPVPVDAFEAFCNPLPEFASVLFVVPGFQFRNAAPLEQTLQGLPSGPMTIPGGMFVAPDFFCDDELKLEDAVALSAAMLSADSEQVVVVVVVVKQELRRDGDACARTVVR